MLKKILFGSGLVCFVLAVGFPMVRPLNLLAKDPVQARKAVADLAIADVFLDEACCLCVDLNNKGSVAINQAIKGEVWVDGSFFLNFFIANLSLGPGQTYHWKGGAPFRVSGSHSVKVVIDSNNQLAESDEANNTMTKSLLCRPSLKPDLIVERFEYKPGPPLGVLVIITIKNVGEAKAGQFLLRLEEDGSLACPNCDISVTELAAGESKTIPVNYVFSFKPHHFKAIVDASDKVEESNERNNIKLDNYSPSTAAGNPSIQNPGTARSFSTN